jgi:hypothetical protein
MPPAAPKDAGLRIRVERELREAFVAACQAQGLAASEVLRDFMRAYADKHAQGQGALFGHRASTADGVDAA